MQWSKQDKDAFGQESKRKGACQQANFRSLCFLLNLGSEPVLRIWDPVPFWPLDPGSRINIFESLVTIFWVKCTIILCELAQILFFTCSKKKKLSILWYLDKARYVQSWDADPDSYRSVKYHLSCWIRIASYLNKKPNISVPKKFKWYENCKAKIFFEVKTQHHGPWKTGPDV